MPRPRPGCEHAMASRAEEARRHPSALAKIPRSSFEPFRPQLAGGALHLLAQLGQLLQQLLPTTEQLVPPLKQCGPLVGAYDRSRRRLILLGERDAVGYSQPKDEPEGQRFPPIQPGHSFLAHLLRHGFTCIDVADFPKVQCERRSLKSRFAKPSLLLWRFGDDLMIVRRQRVLCLMRIDGPEGK